MSLPQHQTGTRSPTANRPLAGLAPLQMHCAAPFTCNAHSRIRIVPLLIAVAVAFSSNGGCTAFKAPALLSRNQVPRVNASNLASHQAQLMVSAGESAERQGNTDDAIRLYEQARTLDPSLSNLSRRLALLYDRQGDDPRAQTAYDQAVALFPDDPDFLNDVGAFHLHRSRFADAEGWFRRALTHEPNHVRALNNLGISLAMQGRVNESFDAFSVAVGTAAAYSNLGVILQRQGHHEQARDHYRRALELDHSLGPTANLLARLASPPDTSAESGTNRAIEKAGYAQEVP